MSMLVEQEQTESFEPVIHTRARSSWLAEHDLRLLDIAAVTVGLLLCVAYGSMFLIPSWTPRFAVLLVTAPVGVAVLALQVARRDAIACVSAVLVGLSALAGITNGHLRSGLIGTIGTEESTLILLASLALLSIGRELTEQGRRAVGWAVVAGTSLSCAIGLLQYLAHADSGLFTMTADRASGLTTNPVYFGAMAAGGFGIVVGRRSSNGRTMPLDVLLAAWFGIAIALSGSRVALGSAVLVAAIVIGLRRTRRALFTSLGATVGVLIGTGITATAGAGASAVNRVSGGGVGNRRAEWGYALDAIRDRPVLGWGWGEYRTAIQGRIDVEVARELGPAMRQSLFDAHNIVLGTTVALGVVGLTVAVTLAVLIGRQARGALAVGASALAISWLMQPMGLATFPLAMLLFGASLSAVAPRVASTSTVANDVAESGVTGPAIADRSWLTWMLVPGLLLGAYVSGVDVSIRRAFDDSDSERVAALADLLPPDPVLADVVAQSWQADALNSEAGVTTSVEQSLDWSRRSVELQDDRSMWWLRHAFRLSLLGRPEEALDAVREARQLEPNSWTAVDLELMLLEHLGETAAYDSLLPLGCELEVPRCD